MAKNGSTLDADLERETDGLDDKVRSLIDRGRAVADRLPDAVGSARAAVDAADGQLDDLSDRGVIAAVGFTGGVTVGLLLAGAPRLILWLALIPTAITVRSAMQRGVRLSRLVQ